MSVRAYRVTRMEFVKTPSFNVNFDHNLMEYLSDKFQFFALMDDDGVGFAVIPVEALQGALMNVSMRDEVKDQLRHDIEWGKQRGWIRYMFQYNT